MIDDDLMKKLDRIEDLPIPEEMLGAYMEGNLHGSEFREIKNFIDDDSSIHDILNIVEDDKGFINELNYSFLNGIVASSDCNEISDDFSLPEIRSLEKQSFTGSSSPFTEDIFDGELHNFIGEDGHFLHSDNNGHEHHINHHDPELDAGTYDNLSDKLWD